jgi:hypothetical protein
MSHTKTPWKADGSNVVSAVGRNIAPVYDPDDSLHQTETALANAAFIVTACNCHDELVGIAQDLALWESDPDHYGGDLADLGQRARTALKNAGGK